MIRIFKIVFFILLCQFAMAQAPSNYTNINGRYRWIAGMFDSTFHIPKGTTPSLRTGGSTNAGALFYKTGDSSLYIYSGTQWLKIAGASGFVPYVGATQDVDLDTWSLYAKSLHIKGNSGQGHLGLKFQSATPNMSANESGVYADASGNFGIKIDNAYTSIFKTSLNSADRTYTFQNKSYTVGDSADIEARVKYTDTASMLSQYYRLAGVGLKNTGQTVYADTLLLSTRAWRQKGIDSVAALINSNVSGTTNYVSKFTATNTIGNSQIFDNGTNVGINTITPNQKLEVSGIVRVSRTTSPSVYLNLTMENGVAGYDARGSIDQVFYTGAVERMRIGFGGDVTISTIANATTNTDKFLVSDAGVIKYRTGAQVLSDIGAASASSISGTTNYIPKFTSSSAIGNSIMSESGSTISVEGSVSIRSNNILQLFNSDNTNGFQLYNSGASGSTGANLIFLSGAVGERMRLDASGNLGLGTTTFGTYGKLSVAGGITILNDNNAKLEIGRYSAGVSNSYIKLGANSNSLRFTNNADNADLMELTNSGNLGLGVTPSVWNSSYKAIQLGSTGVWWANANAANGDWYLGNNYYYSTGGQLLYLTNGKATEYFQYDGQHVWKTAGTGTAGNAISFTQAMTLDASGNLSIGTTGAGGTATDKILAVEGTSSGQINLRYNNTSGAYLYSNASNTVLSSVQALPLLFNTTNTERMRITSGGLVGIGTSTPNISNAASGSTVETISATTSGRNALIELNGLRTNNGDYAGYVRFFNNTAATPYADIQGIRGSSDTDGSLAFATGNSERMRITSGGELLINTTTDAGAYYLQVNGDVYAGAYYESSDRRLKDILSVRGGSDGINTVTFKWKDKRDSLSHIGYIAQEVEKVLPDAVKTNPDGYKTINYDEVQSLKIANLEKEITELKKAIKQLMEKK